MKNIKTVAFTIACKVTQGILEKDFEVYCEEDSRIVYQSKETFTHDEGEEGLNFEYKYLISVEDLRYASEGFQVYLALVVNPKNLKPKKIQDVREYLGCNNDEIITYMDMVDYGIYIDLAYDSFECSDSDDMESCGAKERANEYANIIEFINGMFGFYMDAKLNRIGTTGWDLLKSYLA